MEGQVEIRRWLLVLCSACTLSGKPSYDWTVIDRIFDTYRERSLKPLVRDRFHAPGVVRQTATIPAGLGETYNSIFTGWAYPPAIMASGRNWCISGCGTPSSATAGRRSSPGIARP
jgi:hypothetical protein